MSLRNYANESKSNLRKDVSINFIPETYWIDDAKEKTEFVNKLTGKSTTTNYFKLYFFCYDISFIVNR